MAHDSTPPALAQHLAAVMRSIEEGFAERGSALREAADRLEKGYDEAREDIRRLAHRLRGIAGSAGHPQLSERAARLEHAVPSASSFSLAEGARALAKAAEHARSGQATEEARPAKESSKPDPLGWRVLAVDDEPATRRLLSITLVSAGGCEAEVLEDPARAIELAKEQHFDLAIIDAMMPTMNGLELYRALRTEQSELPIAILSAAAAEELGWKLPNDGRLTWVQKPFRPAHLLTALRAFVERAE